MSQSNKQALQAIRTLELIDEFFEHLKAVGKFPHSGQKPIINALMKGDVKRAFLVCSRNFGKSVTCMIDQALYAGLNAKTKNYIIAPFQSQTKEIYWASGLMQDVIPPSWLLEGDAAYNKSELRAFFKNGSFIKLDGADNDAAVRGYKPNRLTCDEFQDWRKETWDAMKPNLLGKDATVVMVGTPPDIENHFTAEWWELEEKYKRKNPEVFFIHRTIWDNPIISQESKQEYYNQYMSRGELPIWEREYEAKFIKGGAGKLLPQFKESEHCLPIEVIMAELDTSRDTLEYYTVFDPSGTRFGIGFFAYNKSVSKVYLLDEIVETEAKNLSAIKLLDRVKEKEALYYDPRQRITAIYDEAAKLFGHEMANLAYFAIPTQKKQNDKSNNISLLRDSLSKGKFVMSLNCTNFCQDFLNYRMDGNGKIVKEKDEGVDVALYMLAESGYSFNSISYKTVAETDKRFYTVANDARSSIIDEAEWLPSGDFTLDINDDLDDLWNL